MCSENNKLWEVIFFTISNNIGSSKCVITWTFMGDVSQMASDRQITVITMMQPASWGCIIFHQRLAGRGGVGVGGGLYQSGITVGWIFPVWAVSSLPQDVVDVDLGSLYKTGYPSPTDNYWCLLWSMLTESDGQHTQLISNSWPKWILTSDQWSMLVRQMPGSVS